jgi:uncharacterized protein
MTRTSRTGSARRRYLKGLAAAPLLALLLTTAPASGRAPAAQPHEAEPAAPAHTAEATLLAAIEEVAARNEPITIDWRVLAGLNYRTGVLTDALKQLDGKVVRIPGFIVPLEDYLEEAAEFLLVPYYGACIHTPPPPPNQMVHVLMEGGRKARTGWWEPIWLEGRLDVKNIDSPYGVVGFQMAGMSVKPYEY